MIETAIRPVRDHDRAWVQDLLRERWGSTLVVSRGVLHGADSLPGFIAEIGGVRQGLITFHISKNSCQIVTLDSLAEGQGIGSALIDAVREESVKAGCSRLWLITTNDNAKAMRFYQEVVPPLVEKETRFQLSILS